MASPVILELVLDGEVIQVAGGAGPGDHAFEFKALYPRSGAPASTRIIIPTQTIDQVREVGKHLYAKTRLVVRLEEVPEVSRG